MFNFQLCERTWRLNVDKANLHPIIHPVSLPLYTPLVFVLELSFISFSGPISDAFFYKLICILSHHFSIQHFIFCPPSVYRSHNLSLLFWPSTLLPTSLFYFFHPLPLSPPHPTPPFFSNSLSSRQLTSFKHSQHASLYPRLKVKLHLSLHFSYHPYSTCRFTHSSTLPIFTQCFFSNLSSLLLITIVQLISRSTHLSCFISTLFSIYFYFYFYSSTLSYLSYRNFPLR